MYTLYIQIGYYKTLLMEVENKGRELQILQTSYINSGNNFLIGRLNKIEDFAEHLSVKLKTDFKKSLNNIVMILPNDFIIESVIDANDFESKNKPKEIKAQVQKNRHIGLNGLNIMRIGHNSYNDMYLCTEFDKKKMNLILDALQKKGIHIKQVLSPLNCLHHLARNVICPFEVINSNNSSNVVKTGILMVNVGLNRLNFTLVHNNLPIEVREGTTNFVKLIDSMAHYDVSFIKVIRLLNLIGVDGLKEMETSYKDIDDFNLSEDLLLSSLDELEEKEPEEVTEENKENPLLFLDENSQEKKQKKIALKVRNQNYMDLYQEEDSDIHLNDDAYIKFESMITEVLNNLRNELQKTFNYFINNYGIKIANIVVVSSDIKSIDEKLIQYSNLKGNVIELEPEEMIEVEEFSVYNYSDSKIDSQYAMLIGAVLSNHVRGNIYE